MVKFDLCYHHILLVECIVKFLLNKWCGSPKGQHTIFPENSTDIKSCRLNGGRLQEQRGVPRRPNFFNRRIQRLLSSLPPDFHAARLRFACSSTRGSHTRVPLTFPCSLHAQLTGRGPRARLLAPDGAARY